jgi:Fur family ferric uptake transcriptional regulator
VTAPAATSWAEHAERRLAEAGCRRGSARRAIVALLARQPCALSALEIEDALRGHEHRASRASIYRVLDELESLKLVSRLDLGQGIVRYEPLHPDPQRHHHHLVCDDCGDVIPFEDAELERTIDRVAGRVAFQVAEHELVLHGSCGTCRG